MIPSVRRRSGVLRKGAAISALAVVASLATACSSSGSKGTSPSGSAGATAPEKSDITIGYALPDVGTSAPLYIAKAKGYYKDVGLNVNLLKNSQIQSGILGGSIDIGDLKPDPLAQAVDKGANLVMVCGWRYQQPLIVGVAKGINSAEDLGGKDIALGLSASDPNAKYRADKLKTAGWDISGVSVNYVNPPGSTDAYVQLLNAGKLALTYMFPRHVPTVEAAGGKIIYNKMEPVMSDALSTTAEWAKQNPKTLDAFLTATIRGIHYLLDPANKDDIVKIMTDAGFTVSDQVKANWQAEYNTHTKDCEVPQANYENALKLAQVQDPGYAKVTHLGPAQKAAAAVKGK